MGEEAECERGGGVEVGFFRTSWKRFLDEKGGGKPEGACQTLFWFGQIPLFETILLNLNGRLNIFKTKESQ